MLDDMAAKARDPGMQVLPQEGASHSLHDEASVGMQTPLAGAWWALREGHTASERRSMGGQVTGGTKYHWGIFCKLHVE